MLNEMIANFNRFMDQRLNRREQVVVYIGGVILLVFILVQFMIVPLFKQHHQLERMVARKAVELNEIHKLRQEYDVLKGAANRSTRHFSRREKGFTLFSFLDTLAGTAGVKDKISYMKPSSIKQPDSPYKKSQVEMKLDQITMDQLTRVLHGIETSKNMVVVKRLSISRKGKTQGTISVVIQAETLES